MANVSKKIPRCRRHTDQTDLGHQGGFYEKSSDSIDDDRNLVMVSLRILENESGTGHGMPLTQWPCCCFQGVEAIFDRSTTSRNDDVVASIHHSEPRLLGSKQQFACLFIFRFIGESVAFPPYSHKQLIFNLQLAIHRDQRRKETRERMNKLRSEVAPFQQYETT